MLMVPEWKRASWWKLIADWQVIQRFPAGTKLFAGNAVSSARNSKCRWPMIVVWDKPEEKTGKFHLKWSEPPCATIANKHMVSSASDLDTSNDLLEFEAHSKNKKLRVLVDTGSNKTFVKASLIQPLDLISSKCQEFTVELADGHVHKVCNKCNVPLRIAQWKGIVSACVLPLGHWDLILGMDWLRSRKAVLNPYASMVYVDGHKLKSQTPRVKHEGTSLMSVHELKRELKKDAQLYIAVLKSVHADGGTQSEASKLDWEKDETLRMLLDKYADVFQEPPKGLPPARGVEHGIELEPGTAPIHKHGWRMSPLEFEETRKQI